MDDVCVHVRDSVLCFNKAVCAYQFLLECLTSVAHDETTAAADADELLSENFALQLLLGFRNLLVVLAASKVSNVVKSFVRSVTSSKSMVSNQTTCNYCDANLCGH